MCGLFVCTLAVACTPPLPRASSPSTLTIGVPEGSVGNAQLGMGEQVTAFTLEGLTQIGADGRALPKLAESWRWENDGLTLRVFLRPNVLFHNNEPMTSQLAADILRKAVAQPRNQALYASLSDITSVSADGALQVVVTLSRPSALLPEDLDFQLGIGSPAAGTGPYRVVRTSSTEIVLERYERYYLGAPRIEQVVLRPFDTLRTAWTSLMRGELDMVTDVPPNAIEFVENDQIQVVQFARRYQYLVAFNSRSHLFRSSDVRRALNNAIDRQAVIERVLDGAATAATGPLWPGHWAYDNTVRPYEFDPRLAAQLLDEAGYRRGSAGGEGFPRARFRFTCLIPEDFAVLERIGLELQRELYELDVDMQFEAVPIAEYDTRIREGAFEAVLVDMISGPTLGRPYIFWRSARDFKGLNVFGYANAEAERLYRVIRTARNDAAVRSATSGLQRAFLEDPPALFIAWNERARAIRRSFEVPQENGRDPLLTLHEWGIGRETASQRNQ